MWVVKYSMTQTQVGLTQELGVNRMSEGLFTLRCGGIHCEVNVRRENLSVHQKATGDELSLVKFNEVVKCSNELSE